MRIDFLHRAFFDCGIDDRFLFCKQRRIGKDELSERAPVDASVLPHDIDTAFLCILRKGTDDFIGFALYRLVDEGVRVDAEPAPLFKQLRRRIFSRRHGARNADDQ